ncbi:SRPBCC family protein [Streptomyces sp. WAC06614]|uniref:SRPBCC family protein n=1 Tax=Streptomyces sp. WAC06614 TaxID=2487416 RepID=UPI000F76F491|nr:SRPBCC family protein [Streptomyces sp. WAC06614]RSS83818.1 carbon monoxide dehydrogenase [Streptomyces sp. WAC06614]
MEHQVFVAAPVENVRAVLRDAARLARCVPGLQRDADAAAGPLSGRLRLRVGGSTVTYRGALTVTEQDPGSFEITGEGTEARGSGTVKVALRVRPAEADGGTRLELSGTGSADGRAAAFEPEATAAALHRLLDRAAGHLASLAGAGAGAEAEAGAEAGAGAGAGAGAEAGAGGTAEVQDTAGAGAGEPGEGGAGLDDDVVLGDDADLDTDLEAEAASVFGTEVPPSSLDPFLEEELSDLGGAPGVRPPAEAAHARRTMIGRSAEEVDHAPPRGRYAPVPAPDLGPAGGNLRWLAPAAALAVASAVVVGRVLRRRR